MGTTQVYELTVDGRHHRVETTADRGVRRRATWWLDGTQVAADTTSDGSLILSPDEEHDLAEVAGAVRVRFTTLGGSVRATWFEGERAPALAEAILGGRRGVDLVPEPGSPAAEREERMRANPAVAAALYVGGGVGKVAGPIVGAIVVAWLLSRLPSVPWPDLDLPAVPWPDWDLPAIPWPSISLPSWDAPDWLVWILDRLKYVWPILLGIVIARRELTRRREQDALRARMGAGGPSGHAADGSAVRDVPAGEADDPHSQQDEPAHAGDERAGGVEVSSGHGADQPEG